MFSLLVHCTHAIVLVSLLSSYSLLWFCFCVPIALLFGNLGRWGWKNSCSYMFMGWKKLKKATFTITFVNILDKNENWTNFRTVVRVRLCFQKKGSIAHWAAGQQRGLWGLGSLGCWELWGEQTGICVWVALVLGGIWMDMRWCSTPLCLYEYTLPFPARKLITAPWCFAIKSIEHFPACFTLFKMAQEQAWKVPLPLCNILFPQMRTRWNTL